MARLLLAPTVALALALTNQLALVSLAPAQQPVPVGPEFQVNTYTTDAQVIPAVAADGAGNFVVVWYSDGSAGTDASSTSIQGQRYDSTGMPQGAQFQVNSYTTGSQLNQAVAADGAGNFVVVWDSYGSAGTDTSAYSIQMQRYDASGTPLGGEVQVNTYTTSYHRDPAVAVDGAGNFVVVWDGTDTFDIFGIVGQRYDSAGTPQGGEFHINSYTTIDQRDPEVAVDGAGNFVVVWDSWGSAGTDTSNYSVQGQRYDNTGTPQGSQFQVNSYTTSNQIDVAVAADGAGNFVVVWNSFGSAGPDTSSDSILGQRYDSTGMPQGGEFLVNSYTTGSQGAPAVAFDGAGNFVVVWDSLGSAGTDTSSYGIQGQRYDSAGTPQGGQFQVNTYTTGFQRVPAVAFDGTGNFVVVWHSTGSAGTDTSDFSIHGQRFAIPLTTSSTSTSSSTTSSTLAPTDLLPGRVTIIKPGTLAKFVARPATGDTFVLPTANPVAVGGSLRIFDVGTTAGDDSYSLPAGGTPPLGWKGLGSPVGSKGFKYKGAGTLTDPCKVVLVKEKVIKGVCRGTGIMLQPPFTGDVGIVLSLGATDRYCAGFGGDESKNDATMTKRKNAPAPGACP